MCRLVGYKRFTSKKGKEYCVANVISTYSQRDIDRGCVGEKTEEIFLPENCFNLLKPEDVGRELDMSYDYSGGRAYLVDVAVI